MRRERQLEQFWARDTLGFQVDDIQSVYTYIKKLGFPAVPIKKLWGATVFYIHDPEGTKIEFWSQV